MKILPISTQRIFSANKDAINPETGEYKDPLMRWPLRGAAFTNEIGEALRPIIGKYATLTWAPALLYIGADIYDKYKNDQTEYSPDSRRCLKQAVFQGMASIFLPLVAVKAGQNIFSLFGSLSKDKITYNSKEQIIELAKEFVANGNMRAYKNNDNECKQKFLDIVSNNLDFNRQKDSISNPFKKTILKLEEGFYTKFKLNSKDDVNKFAENTITHLIESRKKLLNPDEAFKQTLMYSNYKISIKDGQTKNVAVKSVLSKRLDSLGMHGRFVKTLGGFIALGIAISPIDHFVEKVLIGKIVGPSLDKTKKESIK